MRNPSNCALLPFYHSNHNFLFFGPKCQSPSPRQCRHCCCCYGRLLRPQFCPTDLMIPLEVHARFGHSVRLKDLLYIILFGQNKKTCTAESDVLFVIECSTLSRPCNWKMYAVCNNGTQIYAKCNSYESLWKICMSMAIKMFDDTMFGFI